jgi:hypothetical protein
MDVLYQLSYRGIVAGKVPTGHGGVKQSRCHIHASTKKISRFMMEIQEERPMRERREWREEFRVAGDQVADRIRQLVREGNARRIIVRKPNGDIIREIPLTHGVAAGGLIAMIAPALAAIGAVVALLSEVRIEVVRVGPPGEGE